MALTDVTDGSRIILEGKGKVKLTLAGAVKVGDPLGYSSGWKQADANNSIYAEFVAGQGGVSGDEITAYRIARIGGVSGATAGNPVYLSDTAGGYSESKGTTLQVVGVQESATVMLIEPKAPAGTPTKTVAVDTTLKKEDAGVITVSADGKTITLPAASGNAGLRYTIKATGTHSDGTVVDGNASETIDGAATKTSGAQYDVLDIVCNGTGWDVVGKIGTWS